MRHNRNNTPFPIQVNTLNIIPHPPLHTLMNPFFLPLALHPARVQVVASSRENWWHLWWPQPGLHLSPCGGLCISLWIMIKQMKLHTPGPQHWFPSFIPSSLSHFTHNFFLLLQLPTQKICSWWKHLLWSYLFLYTCIPLPSSFISSICFFCQHLPTKRVTPFTSIYRPLPYIVRYSADVSSFLQLYLMIR